MDNIMVSVLIPNYNHAPYLKDRIDSVLKQTYQNFEVIILDDCSPDNSREVIEAYRGHPKISHIIFNETNSGSTFKQWNKGISLAKGDFIWIAESDDVAEPGFLETLVNGILADENVVLAASRSYYFTQNDGIIHFPDSQDDLYTVLPGEQYVKERLLPFSGLINASMAIFRKETFFNITQAYQSYRYCGDWIFWAEISRQGNVFLTGKHLNLFRKHGNDVTGKAKAEGFAYVEEIQALKYFKESNIIDSETFQNAIKLHYERFLGSKHLLSENAAALIEKDFVQEIPLKLYKYYKFKRFAIKIVNKSVVELEKLKNRI